MRYRPSQPVKVMRIHRRAWLSDFGRSRPMTRDEYQQLRKALPWRDSLACAIMADTGLRISDVLGIRRDDLAPDMDVTERKTGKTRRVHLSPDTYMELQAYLRTHTSPMVIPCHRATLWRSIVRAADAFGWRHISPHSLRKLYAVEYCTRHGLQATQAELMHTNIMTTLAYVTDIDQLLTPQTGDAGA